jgi:hypothetical protein
VEIEQDLRAMAQKLEEAWVTVQVMIAQDSIKDLLEVEALVEGEAETLEEDPKGVADDFGAEINI